MLFIQSNGICVIQEEAPSSVGDKDEDAENEKRKNRKQLGREETSKSSVKSQESKARAQMMAELERLRKDMVTAASMIERPKM